MLRFNFAETRESRIKKYLREDLIFLVVVLLITISAFLLIKTQTEKKINKVNAEIAKLNREKYRLQNIQRLLRSLRIKRNKLKEKLAVVSELDRRRKVPKPLYFFLQKEYMKGVWLKEVKLTSNSVKTIGNIWKVEKFPIFLKSVEENIGKVLFKEIKEVEKNIKNLKVKYYTFKFKAERKDGIPR